MRSDRSYADLVPAEDHSWVSQTWKCRFDRDTARIENEDLNLPVGRSRENNEKEEREIMGVKRVTTATTQLMALASLISVTAAAPNGCCCCTTCRYLHSYEFFTASWAGYAVVMKKVTNYFFEGAMKLYGRQDLLTWPIIITTSASTGAL